MSNTRPSPSVQRQVYQDDYERHNACAWDSSLQSTCAMKAAPRAEMHNAAPAASHQLSTLSSPSPFVSSTSTDMDLIEFSPPNSPHPQDERSDSSGDDFDNDDDGSSGDWFFSDIPEASIPASSEDECDHGEIVSEEEHSEQDMTLAIPAGIDISFDPAPPTHGLTIVSGKNSQYFGAWFIDCKIEGIAIFENCLFINATFRGCIFRGSCKFTTIAFQDIRAVDCVFEDSCHDCRTFAPGEHIGEVNIGDRVVAHNRELPHAMVDNAYMDDQDYDEKTWRLRRDSTSSSRASPLQAPAPAPTSPPTRRLAPAKANRMAKNTFVSSINTSGLKISVIPMEADIHFDSTPSRGISMEFGKGGSCRNTTFKQCQFKGITFVNCILYDVSFHGCTFQNVTFTNCFIMDTQFIDCVMSDNSFTDRKFEDAELKGHNYDKHDQISGYRMPEELKNKVWLAEKMIKLEMKHDERLKTPAEVLNMCKDEVKKNPKLFKETKFVTPPGFFDGRTSRERKFEASSSNKELCQDGGLKLVLSLVLEEVSVSEETVGRMFLGQR